MEASSNSATRLQAGPQAAGRWLPRLQLMLGLGLLVYLVRHIALQWSALSGPEAWVLRTGSPHGPALLLLGTLPFLAYGAVGAVLLLRTSEVRRSPLTTPRWVTGAIALAYLGVHIGQIWIPSPGPQTSAWGAYQQLLQSTGLPWLTVVNALGLTALCLHAALGPEWAVQAVFDKLPTGRALLVLRGAAGLVCFVAWGSLLHLLGHYAIGDGLVPTGRSLDSVAPRTGAPIKLAPPAK